MNGAPTRTSEQTPAWSRQDLASDPHTRDDLPLRAHLHVAHEHAPARLAAVAAVAHVGRADQAVAHYREALEGQTIGLGADPAQILVFDEEGRRLR